MRLLFKKELIENFVQRCAELIQDVAEEKVAIVGIKSGGFFLAKRIYSVLEGKRKDILVGALDITFWRDDISRNPYPIVRGTEINFSIDDIPLFLVDDVVYTGRTTRAALCEIFDYGRPTYVKLFSLVNRVGREIPIHPDFFSFHIKLSENELLEVVLREKGFSFDCGVAIEKGEKISDKELQKLLNV